MVQVLPANTSPYRSGIFGYINYLVEKDRDYILKTLVNGLARLEYRKTTLPHERQRD